MTYSEKLKDPRWQRCRLQILERDRFTCRECYATDKELHVHHKRYLRNTEPWDYPPELLITLCKDCHDSQTKARETIESCIGEMAPESVGALSFFLDHSIEVFGGENFLATWLHWLHFAQQWERKSDDVMWAELDAMEKRAYQAAMIDRARTEGAKGKEVVNA